VTCQMQAALGQANSHLFRINADAHYRTFPTPDQLYNQKHHDARHGTRNVPDPPVSYHLRYNCGGHDLLHDQRIDSDHVLHMVRQSVHHHSLVHNHGQSHCCRNRSLPKYSWIC